jgi:hypothetical protein
MHHHWHSYPIHAIHPNYDLNLCLRSSARNPAITAGRDDTRDYTEHLMEFGPHFSLSQLRRRPRTILNAANDRAVVIYDDLSQWVVLPLAFFNDLPYPHGPSRKHFNVHTMSDENREWFIKALEEGAEDWQKEQAEIQARVVTPFPLAKRHK